LFDILQDGQRIGQQELTRSTPPRFFDIVYPLDASLIRNKNKVTVRFESTDGNTIAAVFGIRMIRSDTDE
jgi:hypothetical protein